MRTTLRMMQYKKLLVYSFIVILIFVLDRLSKLYILDLAETKNSVDIYITPYLNLYLVWNKGIAFGLFSMNESIFYNLITFIIGIIILIIFYMIFKKNNIQRYFLLLIAGGAMGNFYDRLIYTAVPDFIDLHFYGYHWFVFNIADIFISLGVFCLILDELFFYKKT